MKTIKIQLEALSCPSCVANIEGKLGRRQGVENVQVLFNSSKVKVTLNEEQVTRKELEILLDQMGYPVAVSRKAALK